MSRLQTSFFGAACSIVRSKSRFSQARAPTKFCCLRTSAPQPAAQRKIPARAKDVSFELQRSLPGFDSRRLSSLASFDFCGSTTLFTASTTSSQIIYTIVRRTEILEYLDFLFFPRNGAVLDHLFDPFFFFRIFESISSSSSSSPEKFSTSTLHRCDAF